MLWGRNGLTWYYGDELQILRSRNYSYIFCFGRQIIVMKYCAKLLDIIFFYLHNPFYMVYRSCWRIQIMYLFSNIKFVIQIDVFLLRLFLICWCLVMYDLRRTSARRSAGISKSSRSSMRAHPHHKSNGPRQQKNIFSQNNPHNTPNRLMDVW